MKQSEAIGVLIDGLFANTHGKAFGWHGQQVTGNMDGLREATLDEQVDFIQEMLNRGVDRVIAERISNASVKTLEQAAERASYADLQNYQRGTRIGGTRLNTVNDCAKSLNHGHRLGIDHATGKLLGLPWTAGLPAAFRRRYGYDLLPHLVELFFNVDGRPFSQARWHYHDCVTHLFVDSFARQAGEWCRKNGLQFTGHVLMEDTLSQQAAVVGRARRFYEHMQLPGMDLLTERWRAYTTSKQVSSAARQFGRRLRLSETYGCTGWDFPFAGHKALGDWQLALGINLRAQHLSWYTMLGQAKRDYPA